MLTQGIKNVSPQRNKSMDMSREDASASKKSNNDIGDHLNGEYTQE